VGAQSSALCPVAELAPPCPEQGVGEQRRMCVAVYRFNVGQDPFTVKTNKWQVVQCPQSGNKLQVRTLSHVQSFAAVKVPHTSHYTASTLPLYAKCPCRESLTCCKWLPLCRP